MQQTSFIHAAAPHPATLPPEELLRACVLGKGRSSGPGGQHRNKVETLVMLRHVPTGLEAHAGERRSAEENKRVAVRRLRLLLATLVRCPVPLGEIRTELWRSRCSPTGRIACNPEHADYPALLSLAMDVAVAAGGDVKKAALRLGCSMSQLVRLIKDHPPALVELNRLRTARGEHTLK